MRQPHALLAATILMASGPALAADPARATAEALRDRALADPTAYDTLASLTTEVGPRLVGAPQQKAAMEWGLARLKALGFANVHAEPFTAKAWLRGAESAEVVSPHPQRLQLLGLGASVPTPPQGIEAPIAVFGAYEDMLAQPAGGLAGKIAVVNQPMVRTQDGSGYGAINRARTQGASGAARRGAVAYLVRSLSTSDSRLPHAGAMRYAEGAPKIPAAALSVPDAELLAQMAANGAASGEPVRLRLKLASIVIEKTPAWNVVGEIPGREKPDEVIVIGGHLDSWDAGTGAIDDGAGVAITTSAAKLIGDLPSHPRRTIRVVMFGAEEMDYAGAAYFAVHKEDLGKIVLTGESDEGADNIWSLQLPAGAAAHPSMKPLGPVLAPLKIFINPQPSRGSGTDTAEMVLAGVPAIAFHQDATRYFDWHHSADDTLDKVDRAQLNQNVAAWAAALYLAAEGDIDFRHP